MSIKNAATLVIAEREDSDNLYISLAFDPEEGQDYRSNPPESFKLMQLLWDATLGSLAGLSSNERANAPSTARPQ